MAKIKEKKRRLVAAESPLNVEKKIKKKKKTKISNDSDSDSDPNTKIQTLLEPFSKDQLVSLVVDLSLSNDFLIDLIRSAADQDVGHRKVFVHGLGWDATRQLIESIFGAYGEIVDLNAVTDRATGKCKGYAFITYKSRKSVKKLLKNPRVQVGNRVTSCQLASEGPPGLAPGLVSQKNFPLPENFRQRKIYVSNVPVNASPDRLRAFFEKFGEIENGPRGLDPTTGKFKGYALFVYKTVEGAKKALEDPYKVFEGNQLHCKRAAEGGKSNGEASITTSLQPVQPQMLAAAQQVQNMALLGHMNPLYGANLGALMGGYYGMMGASVPGLGLGSYGGEAGPMLSGLQYMYPSVQSGHTSSSSLANKVPGNSASGYSPTL